MRMPLEDSPWSEVEGGRGGAPAEEEERAFGAVAAADFEPVSSEKVSDCFVDSFAMWDGGVGV